MNTKGALGKWLEKKYVQWMADQEEFRSQGDFAEYLGLKQATFNRYYNGERTRIDYKNAVRIAKKLKDFEILDILGYERPSEDELLEGFPPEFRDLFSAALSEARSELVKRGITEGSEEARSIINTAFAKHGLKITFTEPQPD